MKLEKYQLDLEMELRSAASCELHIVGVWDGCFLVDDIIRWWRR